LEIEVAKSVRNNLIQIGDDSIERPWSKYSAGSSAYSKINESEQEKSNELKEKQRKFLEDLETEDPKFAEFVEVMRPRNANSKHTWDNDDSGLVDTTAPIFSKDAEDELYENIPSQIKESAGALETTLVGQSMNEAVIYDPKISDLDYLKLKMKESKEVESEGKEKVNIHPARLELMIKDGLINPDKVFNTWEENNLNATEVDDTNTKDTLQNIPAIVMENDTEYEPSPEMIADTGRIMVRNLPYSCTYEDLEEKFKTFGPIAEVI
jgi:multiple RNA-binding domain-containing protein 1